jgi:hypothetical protein
LAVPGLWTVVWHPYSAPHNEELSMSFSSSQEDLHFLITTTTFLNAHKLTIRTTYSNPTRNLLTFCGIFWPVITSRNLLI